MLISKTILTFSTMSVSTKHSTPWSCLHFNSAVEDEFIHLIMCHSLEMEEGEVILYAWNKSFTLMITTHPHISTTSSLPSISLILWFALKVLYTVYVTIITIITTALRARQTFKKWKQDLKIWSYFPQTAWWQVTGLRLQHRLLNLQHVKLSGFQE
jgi:hypothetical protein